MPISLLALGVAVALGTATPVPATAQTGNAGATVVNQGDEQRQYTINAGPLDAVLNRFALEAGIDLSVSSDLTQGKTSPGLNGQYSVDGGLRNILAGNGLDYRFTGARSVTLAKRSEQGESIQLDPISVIADSNPLRPRPQEQGYWSESSSVTGFRSKPVLDTPSSLTSFPAEVIQNQQARNLTDVIKNDPSVTPGGSPLWYDRVQVRGFNLSTDAVYRDGLTINDQGTIALENKAAVEVNKGLSALRYGATSPGGTINYVVKRPTEEPLARITAFGDSFGGRGVHGDFGGRFGENDQFGIRINAATKERKSQYDRYEHDTKFFSTFFDWHATDRLLIELDYEHQSKSETEFNLPRSRWFNSTDEAKSYFSELDVDTAVVPGWNTVPNEQDYYVGRVYYQLSDNWQAKYAYQKAELSRGQFGVSANNVQPDGSYIATTYYSPNQERNNTAQQVVFEGDVNTFGLQHALAFGYDDLRRDMSFPGAIRENLGTYNLSANGGDIPRPDMSAFAAPIAPTMRRTDQESFFLTDTVTFNEKFEIFAGIRHTKIKTYARDSVNDPLEKTYDESSINPTLGLIYKPALNLTLYTSYAEGIETGGTAPNDVQNANEVMAPLESSKIEAGAKYELDSGALLTAALFEIDKGLEYVDDNNRYVQDGSQVHRGIELTLSGDLTDQLRVITGAAWLDAEVEETADQSLIGKRPQGVPEWQANLYADYDLSPFVNGLSVNGGVFYVGEKAIDTDNTWMADSYVRLDAGVRYVQGIFNDRTATYRLNVENLTDEEYLQNTSGGSLHFAPPRLIKASIEVDF